MPAEPHRKIYAVAAAIQYYRTRLSGSFGTINPHSRSRVPALLLLRLARWRALGGLLLLVLLLSGLLPARAQRVALDANLRNLVIWQAVPDPAGWLWLATDRGGYRYDGQHLVPLQDLMRQGPALPAGSMRAVLRDAAGRLLWGGAAGLLAFAPDSGRLRAVPLPDFPAKRLGVTALGWH